MTQGISIMDIMQRKQITAKLGKMRKAQTFSVYPKARDGVSPGDVGAQDDRFIFVQSERAIGFLDPETGLGKLYVGKGPAYFVHLAFAQPFQFPPEFTSEARAIWDPKTEAARVAATISTLPAPGGLEIDELSEALAGKEATITISDEGLHKLVVGEAAAIGLKVVDARPYRNGLHGIRVRGSAGVPRDGRHFARWNVKS